MKHTQNIVWTFLLQINLYANTVKGSTSHSFEFGSALPALDDYVCTGNDVIETTPSISELQCAPTCASNPQCLGFFYHRDDQICVTTNKHFVDTDGLSGYTGMKYYSALAWMDWGPWSDCSATCGTGTATRTRTCNLNHVTPPPCTGATVETKDCNTYNCIPHAKTCAEWAARGLNQSVSAQIDALESGTGVYVDCDFDSEPGKVITILNHNKEDRTFVNGYEPSGSYDVTLTYDVGLGQAEAVADLSTQCKQFLKYECHSAYLSNDVHWRTRTGNPATYFNGSPPPGKWCACAESNTCSVSGVKCNCDINDSSWRNDEGYVTNKSELPITGFGAGDTGGNNEYAYHTIGPLLCF